MATARRRKEPESVELANLPGLAGTTEPTDERTPTDERRDSEFEDILNELGSDSRIKVWQIVDGKSSYAGEMAGSEFSLDLLLETYGGGDKTLVIYQGKTRRDTVRVSLDQSIPPRNPRAARLAATQPPVAPTAGLGDLSTLLTTMTSMQMQSMNASQQAMTTILGAVATMMTAKPDRDPTEMALKIAEVLRPRDGGGNDNIERFMGMFEKGMNVGKAMTGGDNDSVMPVVGEGVRALGNLIEGIVAEKKANAAALSRGALPATTTATNPPAETPPGDAAQPHEDFVSVRLWVDAARPHMGLLLAASKWMSPAAAADTINRALAEDHFFDLVDDIEDETAPGFGPRLLAYFPDASQVDPEWIGQLVAVILSEYVGDDEDDAKPSVDGGKGGEVK